MSVGVCIYGLGFGGLFGWVLVLIALVICVLSWYSEFVVHYLVGLGVGASGFGGFGVWVCVCGVCCR